MHPLAIAANAPVEKQKKACLDTITLTFDIATSPSRASAQPYRLLGGAEELAPALFFSHAEYLLFQRGVSKIRTQYGLYHLAGEGEGHVETRQKPPNGSFPERPLITYTYERRTE